MEDTYFSDKVNALKTGVFAMLNQKKAELIQRGRKVYNLSVGTPDFPPAPHIMKVMEDACKNIVTIMNDAIAEESY